jgi:hypothetical protein
MGHIYSLILSREITDDESAILREAGCACAVFTSDTLPTNAEVPVTRLDFDDTDSPSLADAIQAGLDAITKVPDLSVPGLTVPAVPQPPADESAAVIEGTVIEGTAPDSTVVEAVVEETATEEDKPAAKKTAPRKPRAKKATPTGNGSAAAEEAAEPVAVMSD